MPDEVATLATRGAKLSLRDRQIVALIGQAKLNKEIAWELKLTEGTVKQYLYFIFRKVGVTNRTALGLAAAGLLAVAHEPDIPSEN